MRERDDPSYGGDGKVPEGWGAKAWANEMRRMANRCKTVAPDRAATLRDWARQVDERIRAEGGGSDQPAT